jgi:hypothetical protein
MEWRSLDAMMAGFYTPEALQKPLRSHVITRHRRLQGRLLLDREHV